MGSKLTDTTDGFSPILASINDLKIGILATLNNKIPGIREKA
jgi:hypothetical protein